MPTQSPNHIIRDSARGRQNYSDARHKLAASILGHPNDLIARPNKYLTDTLFKLSKDKWRALSFGSKDWPILDRLISAPEGHIEVNYESLIGDYIISNADRVNRLYETSKNISASLLRDDGDSVSDLFDSLDEADKQSVFAFRTYAAQRSHSNELLVEYFKKTMSSDWCKKRFLYPFVYYYINNTADRYLDTFLSYVISGGGKHLSEREAIKFILCDEIAYHQSSSFKYYIALLCHPFDACEILINHLELEFSRFGKISNQAMCLLQNIASVIPSLRVTSVFDLVSGSPLAFVLRPSGSKIAQLFGLDGEATAALTLFSDVAADRDFSDSGLPRVLAALTRMRRDRYPTVDDFNLLTANAFKWRFTDSGRLLLALLTSIFMLPRREPDYEARQTFRLLSYFGEISPFMLSSPSGAWAIDRRLLPSPRDSSYEIIESLCDLSFKPANEYSSRLWIKAVHWSLRNAERQFHVAKWLEIVRRDIRVSPGFLTGLRWQWLDDVVRVVRLAPFRGRESGAYALLLMQIEERHRDPTLLRSAIEPFAATRSFDGFVGWLIAEFRSEAVAFVRYFLTPENILLLKLAPNYTAALSSRIAALETCVKLFKFGPLLDENRFQQEAKTLTTLLLLSNVSVGQFEIPWDSFRQDIAEKEGDTYSTYLSLTVTANEIPLLGKARVSTPHMFRNGKTVNYDFENRYWPLVFLLLSIIDGFIEHPSFGIEVLLSTRFRHDTMRREYARVLAEAKEANILGVPRLPQREMIDHIAVGIYDQLATWLNRRMQSDRPGRPDALFDFTPTQGELHALTMSALELGSLEEIIVCSCNWLQARLDEQVVVARESFLNELEPSLHKRINDERDLMCGLLRFRASDVTKTAALLVTVVAHVTQELRVWFESGDAKDRQSLTFAELKIAVDGVFETQITSGELRTQLKVCQQGKYQIPPEKVRLCFDLLCELFANAARHGRRGRASVKIWPFEQRELSGFGFSTPIESEVESDSIIAGRRYESLSDALFREGNSGLQKVASLAASLVGENVSVQVCARNRIFHVVVPLRKSGLVLP
jgi:hypothetical protein